MTTSTVASYNKNDEEPLVGFWGPEKRLDQDMHNFMPQEK